jgi:hypothetical protein
MSARRRVRLHIESLVLEGVSRSQRDQVVDALRGELSELLSVNAAGLRSQGSRSVDSVQAGELPLGGRPAQTGKGLAGAIVRAVNGGA